MKAKDALGRHGEVLATDFLEDRGISVVDRNWRCRTGEIDLVAYDGECLVIAEVKARRSLRGKSGTYWTTDACLEPGSASQPERATVGIHDETADRIRPKTLAGRDGFWSVVTHLSDGSAGAAAGFVPAVKSICGGVPQFEPGRRVVESGIVLVQAQVFGPELEAESVG